MSTKRQKRVAEQIQAILSDLFRFEADDPRLNEVTVMDVRIDRELMYAEVFISSLEGDAARDSVMTALASAGGFLRRELASRMRTQHTPELRFKWDETLAYGDHIEDLLSHLHDQPPDGSEGDSEADTV